MTDQTHCPSSANLQGLVNGRLAPDLAESIAQHLDTCDHCKNTIAGIASRDETFLDAIRKPPVNFEFQSEQPCADAQQLVRQIAREASKAGVSQVDETVSVAAPSQDTGFGSSASPASEMRGLRPAEREDEIGRLGSYRILDVLGAGGMGMVYRAEDPLIQREVAIKTIKPESARGSARERFLREARCSAAIDHDNIVKIYEVGEDEEVSFIVMPMLRGESLKSRLARQKRLDQSEVLQIGLDVAQGLAAAHQRGLIHRDIKPDNLWIEADTGRVKILDFGLARADDDDTGLTRTGMVLGTPKYMSPEQANGDPVDQRSDLFSLGSVLYELVTGQQPFQGKSLPAILLAVSTSDTVPIQQAAPEVDAELADLIANLMHKNPADRPQTAAAAIAWIANIQQRHKLGQYRTLSPATQNMKATREPAGNRRIWSIRIAGAFLAIVLLSAVIAWRAGTDTTPGISPAEKLVSNQWQWTPPVMLGAPVNTALLEVSPEISLDGLELLFSRQDNLYIATRASISEAFDRVIPLDNVNSSYSEDAATLSCDRLTLIIASQRIGYSLWMACRKTVDDEFEGLVELWPASRASGNTFQTPHLSNDGLSLYLTFNGDIAVSHRSSASESFSLPVKLGGNVNSGEWESHPTLTHDESMMIYRSHREGGIGDGDLWRCSRIEGDRFSDPINMGPAINTSRLESGPSLSPDGETLYLMSNRDNPWDFNIWVTHRVPISK